MARTVTTTSTLTLYPSGYTNASSSVSYVTTGTTSLGVAYKQGAASGSYAVI